MTGTAQRIQTPVSRLPEWFPSSVEDRRVRFLAWLTVVMNIVIVALVGALAGSGLGGVLAWLMASGRAKTRQSRWVAAARQQLAASTNANRTKILKLTAELDKERESLSERVTAAGISGAGRRRRRAN